MTEKQLSNHLKKAFKQQNISCYKLYISGFSCWGWPDFLVFNQFKTYGLEIKGNFKTYQPTQIQIATAKAHAHNLIFLFVDTFNYGFIFKQIIKNNAQILNHYAQKQLTFWSHYYQN